MIVRQSHLLRGDVQARLGQKVLQMRMRSSNGKSCLCQNGPIRVTLQLLESTAGQVTRIQFLDVEVVVCDRVRQSLHLHSGESKGAEACLQLSGDDRKIQSC